MKEFRCYEVKIEESERPAITGSWTQDTWLKQPVLCHWATCTTTRQPPSQSRIYTAQVVMNAWVAHVAATQHVPAQWQSPGGSSQRWTCMGSTQWCMMTPNNGMVDTLELGAHAVEHCPAHITPQGLIYSADSFLRLECFVLCWYCECNSCQTNQEVKEL